MAVRQTSGSSRYLSAAGGARIAHIDGLRAIAVLSVVAFHAGVPGVPGGFVGVDVFFVISGYLIINHIVQELAAGKFSFAKFYARRTLRLFPPLFVMIAVATLAAAVILVAPTEWEWFGLSAATSALFVSNFFFLSKQGYFDIDAYEKPLLHVWSLSVEEQFYFVVPLLLVGLFVFAARRRVNFYRVLAVAAGLVFVASLVGCITQTDLEGRNYAFYLTPWRAWEFAAGGAIGFLRKDFLPNRAVAEIAGLVGLALIAGSIVMIGEGARFPGYLIATGLAAPNSAVIRLIALRPFTYVGLVSYGWYLWHWPMISFARIAQFGDPSLPRDFAMAALSFGVAVATYHLVEVPARRVRERVNLDKAGLKLLAGGMAASLALAAVAGGLGGAAYWWLRQDPVLTTQAGRFITAAQCPANLCASAKGQTGILTGDSHSDRIWRTLGREAEKHGADIRRIRGAPPADVDFAVLFYRWNPKPEIYGTLEQQLAPMLRNRNSRVLLVGSVPEFRYKVPECVFRARRYGESLDRCAMRRDDVEKRRVAAMTAVKAFAARHSNIRFADPLDLFCTQDTCHPYDENGVLLYRDDSHLSVPYGAEWLYYHFKEDFWWVLGGRGVSPKAASSPVR
jgi:peptidoglycan/LPS O-acetylase OafA/YrhL